MGQTPRHLKTLEEIERECIPGLVRVLKEEGLEAVRYALWDTIGWHRDYDPCLWRSRADEERKRVGRETWVRMEKIIALVLQKARERQVEEAMDALEDGPEGLYKRPSWSRTPEVTPGTPGPGGPRPSSAWGTGGSTRPWPSPPQSPSLSRGGR